MNWFTTSEITLNDRGRKRSRLMCLLVLQYTAYTLPGNEVPDKLIPSRQQVRVIKHER